MELTTKIMFQLPKLTNLKMLQNKIIKAITGCNPVMSLLPPPHHTRQTITGHTRTCSSAHMESITKYMLTFVTYHCCLLQSRHSSTRVGTLIAATIYLQLIQNRYMLRSFTVLQCSHQHCVQPVASDVEVVGYL